jgi:hypothetical protein
MSKNASQLQGDLVAPLSVCGPRGDRAMRMRFWGGITRGHEKWVKLAIGHFLRRPKNSFHAPSTPKPHAHGPITALRYYFFERIKGQNDHSNSDLKSDGGVQIKELAEKSAVRIDKLLLIRCRVCRYLY